MKFYIEEKFAQTLPASLLRAYNIFSNFETHPECFKYDIFYILLCVLVTENDFVPQLSSEGSTDNNYDDWLNKMFCSWKSTGRNYSELFVLKGFAEMESKLIMVPVGSSVLINFVISDSDITTYTTCLLLDRYLTIIKDKKITQLVSLDVNLASVAFKDRVVTPARSAILSQYGYASASLQGLPKELQFNILIHLEIKDVLNVMKTCNRMKSLSNDSRIWKYLVIRDFTVQEQRKVDKWKVESDESIDYRDKYKKLYSVKRETKTFFDTLRIDMRVENCEETPLADQPADILHVHLDVQKLDYKIDMSSLTSSDERDTSTVSILKNKDPFSENRERLSLAYERLHSVPRQVLHQYGPHVKILDLSHNNISNFDFLTYFENLESLILDSNPVTQTTVLPHLPNLQLLWLNHCKVGSLFPWLRRLRDSVPGLRYLCLMGNPAAPSYNNDGTFYEYLQYRLFVISVFHALLHLDDRRVTEEQRTEAARLYPMPLLRRLHTLLPSAPAPLQWLKLHFVTHTTLPHSHSNTCTNLLI